MTINELPAMKPLEEVQRAHDILHSVVTGAMPAPFGGAVANHCHASLDVLCWVLGHDHNKSFANNLAAIERELTERGLVLQRAEHPFVGDPPAPTETYRLVKGPTGVPGIECLRCGKVSWNLNDVA